MSLSTYFLDKYMDYIREVTLESIKIEKKILQWSFENIVEYFMYRSGPGCSKAG